MITTIEYQIEINDTDTEEKLDKFYYKIIKKLDNKLEKGNNIVIKICKGNNEHSILKSNINKYLYNFENYEEILKKVKFVEYKNDNLCLPIRIKLGLDIKDAEQINIKMIKSLEEGKNVILDFNYVDTLTDYIIFELIGKTILGLYDKGKIDNLNKLKFMNTSDYLKIQFKGLYEASSTFFNLKGKPKIITPSYI